MTHNEFKKNLSFKICNEVLGHLMKPPVVYEFNPLHEIKITFFATQTFSSYGD